MEERETRHGSPELDALFPRYPSSPSEDGYLNALQEYGFCIVKVLNEEECDEAVKELFQEANKNPSQKMKIAQDNPMSWENENWPTAGGPGNRLMDKVALGQRAFYNRTHENIYKVFCHIFNEETKLWCSIDKWGFMRPTKDLDWVDDQGQPTKIDRPDWKRALDPHWDLNPWNYEPGLCQGLVALVDCPEEVGGFCTVPGSANYLKEWAARNSPPTSKFTTCKPSPDDPMIPYMQRVPLRKGELVIFSAGQLHASFVNNSNKWRIVQFIRMLPALSKNEEKDRFAPRRVMASKEHRHIDLNTAVTLTPLGRKLVGLGPWPTKRQQQKQLKKEREKLLAKRSEGL